MTSDRLFRGAVIILAALAIFASIQAAAPITRPLLLAAVMFIVLSPLSQLGECVGLPDTANAVLTMLVGLGTLVLMGLALEPSIQDIVDRAPAIWREVRWTLYEVQHVFLGMRELTQEVAETLGDGGAAPSGDGNAIPSVQDALLQAPAVAGEILTFVASLFFLLLARNDIYRWLGRVSPRLDGAAIREVERGVARYFLTVAVINIGFGLLTTLVFIAIGMPSPVLWGVIAAGMNFMLYLGPLLVAAALLVAGAVVFDGAASLLPAALFVGLNLLEGQFVTPALLGRQMNVNPLLIFASLLFWLWLIGPVGGFVAIPILIAALATRERLCGGPGEPSGPQDVVSWRVNSKGEYHGTG